MRKSIKWSVLLVVVGLMAYFGVGILSKAQHKKEVEKTIQTLPDFTMQTIHNHAFSSKSLAGKAIAIIYFDPDCEHCQQEARAFRRQAGQLKEMAIIWVSSQPRQKLQHFARTYGLTALPKVTVGQISKETVYETFGFTTVPSILIYNTEGQLVKTYKGETKIEALTASL
ncbi:peroxiredoxin family protein [Larkinella sp.]|uniref:peroxiredoxin family protein n=1 Tax=Larkinella sp. TaxID=2034517 RepID=UPI003BAB0520